MLQWSVQYTICTANGVMKKGPGLQSPVYRPKRSTTAFSHRSPILNEPATRKARIAAMIALHGKVTWP
ncbi:MAG: hypothetical protein WBJ52_09360 [Methanoregulaceae archaeon]